MYRLLSCRDGLPWIWSQRLTIIKIHSRYASFFDCVTCGVEVEVVAELDKWQLKHRQNEDRGHEPNLVEDLRSSV
jgi:hypothetical protein